MSGAAATESSSSGSDSDDPSSSSSDSEQGSESGKCVQEAGPASGPEEEEEVASGAGASGAGAPPPDPDAVSLDPSIKKRNRNTEKWLLLKEWDAVQADPELIHREKLEIVTDLSSRLSRQISCSQRPHTRTTHVDLQTIVANHQRSRHQRRI